MMKKVRLVCATEIVFVIQCVKNFFIQLQLYNTVMNAKNLQVSFFHMVLVGIPGQSFFL